MKPINKFIDHTLLSANATESQIKSLCKEAEKYEFASVCVNSDYVSICVDLLKDSDVMVASVVGFPLGANLTSVKVLEAEKAFELGADEIDMVINVGALKSGKDDKVLNDIKKVVEVSNNRVVKVIIETCYLTKNEKTTACKLAMQAGASYVKTSTGFGSEGAKVEDIKLMKSIVGDKLGIKASGGIRDYEKAKSMIEAGATRIGASSGIKIVEGSKNKV